MTLTKDNISNIMRNVENEITAPWALGREITVAPRDRDNDIDPIIRGLLTHLPQAGEVWPEEKRKLWLSLLEGGFKLIYQEAKCSPMPAAPGQDETLMPSVKRDGV